MRRPALALLLLAALPLGPRRACSAPDPIELAAGTDVHDTLVRDVDGDGIPDLFLLEGRLLRGWKGRRGALPDAAPTWTLRLDADVSFVDAVPPFGAPKVLALGSRALGARRLDGKASEEPGGAGSAGAGLGWHDHERARFAPLCRTEGVLVPGRGDVLLKTWLGAGDDVRMPLAPFRSVEPPGPFLEDTCEVVSALPEVFVGVAAEAGSARPALWALDGTSLVAQTGAARVTYDLAFLHEGDTTSFDQRLLDLDGDRRPDLLHRIHTNRETHYGFFLTRPTKAGARTGPSHKPATSALYLPGFQLDPDFVDLDGDGALDLVITSMQINAKNMFAALTSGGVTAETRAFLNRSKAGKGALFAKTPDAVVKSRIGVKVQFNYAGNIEVIRSFLILLDGDYDGDGRRDLAIRTGPDTMTVRRGTAAGVWAGDAEARAVRIPPPGGHPDVEGHAADLDGDGKDEFVLVYRKPPGGRDRVRLVDPGM